MRAFCVSVRERVQRRSTSSDLVCCSVLGLGSHDDGCALLIQVNNMDLLGRALMYCPLQLRGTNCWWIWSAYGATRRVSLFQELPVTGRRVES